MCYFMKLLTIIIVSYNIKELLKKCLEALYRGIKDIDSEIIIVDNASLDGSLEMIKESFPQVKLIQNRENFGFAKAVNQGIRTSQGKYILLLNPDAFLKKDTLKEMIFYLENDKTIGALGPKILNLDGTLQPSFGNFPSLVTEFFQFFYLHRFFPFGRQICSNIFTHHLFNKPHEVDWLTGACFLIRKKVVEEVGLLNEFYFMSVEDIDWCYRLKKAGWKIYYYPKAEVLHHHQATSKTFQIAKQRILEENKGLFYFYKKHWPKRKIRFQIFKILILLRKIPSMLQRKFFKITILIFLLFLPQFGSTKDTFPKIANYYLKWAITKEEADQLAKADLLILDMENQENNPEILKYLRQKNPKIKILAYVTSEEVTNAIWFKREPWSKLRNKLYGGIQNNWWLKDPKGNHLAYWHYPTAWMLNLSTDWSIHLANFMHQEVMATGLWDGIFYDVCFDDISWINKGEIDINNDGLKDPPHILNQEWQRGMKKLLIHTRNLIKEKIILCNSPSNFYNQYLNGRMFENFPFRNWEREMKDYQSLKNGYQPALAVINTNTENKGDWNNFPKFRFGLTSTLMGDGYYSFDFGDKDHGQLWWYDEYEVFLGKAKKEAFNIFEKDSIIKEGVWRRDFEHGLVLVNSSSKRKNIDLEGEYEKIRGIQDIKINNGAIVSEVSLEKKDGLVLLRPIERMIGSVFTNGSFVRIFDKRGRNTRNGFFAYEKSLKGGENIIITDLDGDDRKEIVRAGKNLIEIYRLEDLQFSGQEIKIASFKPYGQSYDKNVNISIGDLDGDGKMEIVTGTEKGGGPHVRIFNAQGKLINSGFFAYAKDFRGGVNVAVGDLDGDDKAEIITGAGLGGGPHVRIFNAQGKLINSGFFAYAKDFRGGVNVAVGDLDGDDKAEIITGAGFTGGPQIRTFNYKGKLIHPGFFAFNPKSRNGVKVAINDLDSDGKLEILGMSTDVFTVATELNRF